MSTAGSLDYNHRHNVDIINECNKSSKYIHKYQERQQNVAFMDYKQVPNAPEHYIQETWLRPNSGSPVLPTNAGDKFTWTLPNIDILTGLVLVITLTTTADNTAYTSRNTAALFWNLINLTQYGKTLLNYHPSYVICRNNEAPSIEEEEAFETIIWGAPLNNDTQTYFLPLFGPMFDKCNNYLFLEFFKNLQLEAYWSGLGLSSISAVSCYLACYSMHTNVEYKNSLLASLRRQNFTLPWYAVRSFNALIPEGATSFSIDLSNQFLTAKNIYLFMVYTQGNETSFTKITVSAASQVIFVEDFIQNMLKKYYSPDRKVYWGWNLNSVRIPFGLLQERLGWTGGACLIPGPYIINIECNSVSTTSTYCFCHIEHYTELEVDAANGLLNTTAVY